MKHSTVTMAYFSIMQCSSNINHDFIYIACFKIRIQTEKENVDRGIEHNNVMSRGGYGGVWFWLNPADTFSMGPSLHALSSLFSFS